MSRYMLPWIFGVKHRSLEGTQKMAGIPYGFIWTEILKFFNSLRRGSLD